jgi:hypothetical protein
MHTYICLYVCACPCLHGCHVSKYTHVRTCAGGTLTWKCRISTRRRRRNMSGTHGVLAVPNGAKPHSTAAYSRVLRIGYSGTASTSSRRDSSASFRHGPSLAHIRAGTDQHGAVSAIAKRATAKLARMPAAEWLRRCRAQPRRRCGRGEPSPIRGHSGGVCACKGARRRGAADRGRVSALARCALRRHSDPRNRQALRGMVRSHRSWKHSRLRLIPTYWPLSRSRPTFRFHPICEYRGAELPMVC